MRSQSIAVAASDRLTWSGLERFRAVDVGVRTHQRDVEPVARARPDVRQAQSVPQLVNPRATG